MSKRILTMGLVGAVAMMGGCTTLPPELANAIPSLLVTLILGFLGGGGGGGCSTCG